MGDQNRVNTARAVANGLRYWRHAVTARDQFEATLPNLIPTRQAAALVGVPETRIRRWACDGHLTRYGRVNGVAYYDPADVIRVEKAMRTARDWARIRENTRRAMLDDH
jgi:hypothetical protein